jgi:hypothetical protein
MLLGDGIIVFAQILVAFQVVYEELFISKYNVGPFLKPFITLFIVFTEVTVMLEPKSFCQLIYVLV